MSSTRKSNQQMNIMYSNYGYDNIDYSTIHNIKDGKVPLATMKKMLHLLQHQISLASYRENPRSSTRRITLTPKAKALTYTGSSGFLGDLEGFYLRLSTNPHRHELITEEDIQHYIALEAIRNHQVLSRLITASDYTDVEYQGHNLLWHEEEGTIWEVDASGRMNQVGTTNDLGCFHFFPNVEARWNAEKE